MIKEPKDIDLIIESEPWTDEELSDFRALMKKLKAENRHIPTQVRKKLRRPTKAKSKRAESARS